jgi:hypothetical protein
LISTEQLPPLTGENFPAAFRAADHGAIQKKRNHLWASRLDLLLILAGAVSTSWAIESAGGRLVLAIAGALSLGLGLLISVYMKISDAEKAWFGYRAVAESIKTMAWRYMTQTSPYGHSLSPKEADGIFTEQMGQVLRMPRIQHAILAAEEATSDQITPRMREIREMPTAMRKLLYMRERVKDEQVWYASKAKANARKGSRMLIATILCQGLAMGAAILLVRWPEFNFNFASVFSAAAAAIIAWQELKRNQELAYAYGQAAHELGLIMARERHVETDDELSLFVSDAENAISREHTMWLARRDNV